MVNSGDCGALDREHGTVCLDRHALIKVDRRSLGGKFIHSGLRNIKLPTSPDSTHVRGKMDLLACPCGVEVPLSFFSDLADVPSVAGASPAGDFRA